MKSKIFLFILFGVHYLSYISPLCSFGRSARHSGMELQLFRMSPLTPIIFLVPYSLYLTTKNNCLPKSKGIIALDISSLWFHLRMNVLWKSRIYYHQSKNFLLYWCTLPFFDNCLFCWIQPKQSKYHRIGFVWLAISQNMSSYDSFL